MPSAKSLTVGVLGGMGPDATVDFVARVIAATPAEVDDDHIRLIVDHNPLVPSRQAAILEDGEDPGEVMADMACGLQAAGADFLVMPCNTAHAFQDAIVRAIDIPFVSIVDVTVGACGSLARIGLLATAACLHSGVYERAFAAKDTELVQMTRQELAEFTRLVAAIKSGDRNATLGDSMRGLALALLERGAEAIVAGCTEIPLVLDAQTLEWPLISSTDLLAQTTVARALFR